MYRAYCIGLIEKMGEMTRSKSLCKNWETAAVSAEAARCSKCENCSLLRLSEASGSCDSRSHSSVVIIAAPYQRGGRIREKHTQFKIQRKNRSAPKIDPIVLLRVIDRIFFQPMLVAHLVYSLVRSASDARRQATVFPCHRGGHANGSAKDAICERSACG